MFGYDIENALIPQGFWESRIPELFAIKANPTIDAIVITGNFNCFKVDQKISAPCRYVTPSNGIEITVANKTAVPGADK